MSDLMRALLIIMLGAGLLAGCGDSIGEQVANSPEVQQRLVEMEKQRKAELEQKKKQLDEIQASTSAALRAAEELRKESAPSIPATPSVDADQQQSSASVPPKTVVDPPAAVDTDVAKPSTEKAPVKNSPVAVKANSASWAQLRAGMTSEAVKKLLGPPTATSEDRTLVYWHYGPRAGSGRVAFLTSGQLVAWETPLH
jgi:hypothetical protein